MKQISIIGIFILMVSLNIFSQEKSKPNFIVFIADDVSFDDYGYTGNKVVQTPNIDKLAANGIIFNNVYLTASSCSPSRNSIVTGRYPHNNGAPELGLKPPIDMLAFPELLKNNGYFCGLAGKYHLGEYAKRAFDVIYIDRKVNGWGGETKWLKTIRERPKDKPFFIWYASYDAHRYWEDNDFSGTHNPDDITPPPLYADEQPTKIDMAKYYDEIKRFDFSIGEVIEELKKQNVFDNTMIIVMADNGRCFPGSKTRVNDRGMKTPFVIHWPEHIKQKGASSNSLISVIDIAPTILRLAGVEPAEQFQGHSFDNLLTHPDKEFRNYVFAEHNWHDYEAHERMVRNREFMYILNSRPQFTNLGPADGYDNDTFKDLFRLKDQGKLTTIQAEIFTAPRPSEELYDCVNDPLQYVNIASDNKYQEELGDLRNILKEWMDETGDSIPDSLTKDWFYREPGYKRTPDFKIRGEVPGSRYNATKNNNKGKF